MSDENHHMLTELAESLASMDRHVEMAKAWKVFFRRETIDFLINSNFHIEPPSFHYSQADATLNYQGSNEDHLRTLINKLAIHRPYDSGAYVFKRYDIYTKEARACFPLSWFVTTACDCKLTFTIPMHMNFSPNTFRLRHQKTGWRERWARLYCTDSRLETSIEGKREVAEKRDFAENTTRQEMFDYLLNEVKANEKASLFTILDCHLRSAMIDSQQEPLRLEALKKTF